MKDFKSELNRLYENYQVDEVKNKRLENKILAGLEDLPIHKKPFYMEAKYMRIASIFVMALTYIIFKQVTKNTRPASITAKLEVVAEGLDVDIVAQTTLALGAPDEALYQNVYTQAQHIDYKELKDIMEDI